MNLTQISKKYGTDKVSHGFTQFYDLILKEHKDRIENVLEIGILNGASLFSWNYYFQKARIYGIDLKEKKLRMIILLHLKVDRKIQYF